VIDLRNVFYVIALALAFLTAPAAAELPTAAKLTSSAKAAAPAKAPAPAPAAKGNDDEWESF